MAAKFYEGASVKTTRTLSQSKKVSPPQSNSMKGMPGFVRTTQDDSDGGLKDHSGVGPHREGPIGKKGASNGKFDAGKFRGSSDKSYRATSTGAPGKLESNKGSPSPRKASEKEGAARGKPKGGFHQQDAVHPLSHPGTMESLRGRAKTSYERK